MHTFPIIEKEYLTKFTPDDIAHCLAHEISPQNIHHWIANDCYFSGTITEKSFMLCRNIGFNSFQPMLYGTFFVCDGKTLVKVTLKLKKITKVASCIYVVLCGLLLILTAWIGEWYTPFIPLGMAIFLFLFSTIAFKLSARGVLSSLENMLQLREERSVCKKCRLGRSCS